jgi:hypothetical protein
MTDGRSPRPSAPSRPIFVGGTGRSGTTVVGQLLGRHPDVFPLVPTEVRFLTASGGLIDLMRVSAAAARRSRTTTLVRAIRGTRPKVTAEAFSARMLDHWYRWTAPDETVRGLHLGGLERPALEWALDGLGVRMKADPEGTARALAEEILGRLAHGSSRWVETTPGNAIRANGLRVLFPDMRLVHVVRDGRDAAASIATMFWGPNDIVEALDWWAGKTAYAYAALASFPEDRHVTVRLEDLVQRDREASYERLREAMELTPSDEMRAFFDERMSSDRAHVGRWRSALSRDDAARFDDRYRLRLRELRQRFGPVPPTEDLDAPPVGAGDDDHQSVAVTSGTPGA